jgi:hypothetical protein
MEIAAHDASGTYRAIYTVSIGESIYVNQPSRRSKARDAEAGDGPYPAAAKTAKKRRRKERSLSGSPARATYSLTSAWLTPASI